MRSWFVSSPSVLNTQLYHSLTHSFSRPIHYVVFAGALLPAAPDCPPAFDCSLSSGVPSPSAAGVAGAAVNSNANVFTSNSVFSLGSSSNILFSSFSVAYWLLSEGNDILYLSSFLEFCTNTTSASTSDFRMLSPIP